MKNTATHSINSLLLISFLLTAIFFLSVQIAGAQDANRMAAVQAVEQMLMEGNADFDAFINDKLSDAYRASLSDEAMAAHLAALRKAVAGAGGLDIGLENDEIHLMFSEGADATVVVRMEPGNAGQIGYLGLKEPKSPEELTADELMDHARRTRVRAIEALGSGATNEHLQRFVKEHFVEDSQLQDSQFFDDLRDLSRVIAASGVITVDVAADGTHLNFRGPSNANVIFRMAQEAPYLISEMDINTNPDVSGEEANKVKVAPITWKNVEQRLAEEAAAGFSGAVLVVRDGQVVLHQGYGKADRETGRPVTTETIFGIGSTPIDFTRAAILKLVDDGTLKLSDTIDTFYPDVPKDKAGITIDHLMTGKSGLPNFHHIPGQDENYDLSWIDRAEAERRMFAQPLLFAPGEGQSHSHSAFVLLAAIIEKVSDHTYAEYLQQTFFDPIGMDHTGFYGKDSGFSDDDMAVGYGHEVIGPKNTALHWGPTSWLMMGSGGMVSTADDMHKWLKALFSGDYLSQRAMTQLGRGAIVAGSSDRGFLFMYRYDPDNTVIFSSNADNGDGGHAAAVANELMMMAKPGM